MGGFVLLPRRALSISVSVSVFVSVSLLRPLGSCHAPSATTVSALSFSSVSHAAVPRKHCSCPRLRLADGSATHSFAVNDAWHALN